MPEPRICFVIPTYNEAANIPELLRQLSELYPEALVLVVDDSSPDGTGTLVEAFAERHPGVHLLSGPKNGLGVAYLRGIRHAIDVLSADIVVQMDADFSHDPRAAAQLFDALADGADVAIGSRYVDGGGVDESWGFRRRQLSLWGNRLARYVAGLWGVNDCTAGFKAIKKEALERAHIDQLRVRGYAFQVALLHRLLDAGAVVVERPIYFKDRSAGSTKLGLRDVVEFFLRVWWLRVINTKTFIKYCITGASGVAVNLGAFAVLTELSVGKFLASPIAIELSVIWNFLLNNYWTFRHRRMAGRKRVRGMKFNLVSIGTIAVSYSTFLVLTMLFPETPALLHQAVAIVPAVLLNYFVNSFWTFRDTSSRAGPGAFEDGE